MAAKIELLVCCTVLWMVAGWACASVVVSSNAGPLNLIGESNAGKGIALTLLHRDHELSPLRNPLSTSLKERFTQAVRRSHARKERLRCRRHARDIESLVYSSPGEYVMTGKLGTPSVDFAAIVDTGSDLIWLQCDPCVECVMERDPLFNPNKSLTYKKLPCSSTFCDALQTGCNPLLYNLHCPYLYSYGDGSFTSGLLSSETALWNTTGGKIRSFANVAFGCSSRTRGDYSGADGLVGFGAGPLSLPSQIGSEVGREFSYCLGDYDSAINNTSTLTVGNDSHKVHHAVGYTPIVSNPFYPSFYYLQLESIEVGGHRLDIHPEVFSLDRRGNGGNIIDSGTTLTYLIQPAYDAVLKSLQETVSLPIVQNETLLWILGLDLCFDLTRNPQAQLPVIAFHFLGNLSIGFPMQNTFITVEVLGFKVSCLAMASSPIGQFGIIGNHLQQNFKVIYDLEHQRLGFSDQKCYN